MSWKRRTAEGIEGADRFLGRLLYRVLGVGAAMFTVLIFWFGVSALRGGEWMGVVILGFALASGLFTRYCFRPERRLSDVED